jgi:hypothetical protein
MENRNQMAGAVTGGIMLIGVGMLLITNWWWPGIMLVVGTAVAAGALVRGQVLSAIGLFLLFLAIPVGIAIVSNYDLPWVWIAGFMLIAVGGSVILRGLLKPSSS